MNKVYVIWNPLHERVVCVHSSEDSECYKCIEEREKVKGTAYSLGGEWFVIDSVKQIDKEKYDQIQEEVYKLYRNYLSENITDTIWQKTLSINADLGSSSGRP